MGKAQRGGLSSPRGDIVPYGVDFEPLRPIGHLPKAVGEARQVEGALPYGGRVKTLPYGVASILREG